MFTEPFWKMVTTAAVWAVLLGMVIAITASGRSADFLMMAVILGAGALATVSIWVFSTLATGGRSGAAQALAAAEKAKRRSKVERLLDGLSETDIEELRIRLVEGDGEAIGIDELLAAYDDRKRRR